MFFGCQAGNLVTVQFIHLFNDPTISLSGWSAALAAARQGGGCAKAVPIVSVNASATRYCCHGHHQAMGWFGEKGESFQVKRAAQPHNQVSKYTGVCLGRWTFTKLKKRFGNGINKMKVTSLNSSKLRLCDICVSAKIRSFFSFWRQT